MKVLIFLMFSVLLSLPPTLENYNSLDLVLKNYVDSLGRVNYNGILKNPNNLNDYFKFIEKISPKNKPSYFKTKNEKTAYWINAYNALIIKLMIENPNKNILEISFGHAIWLTRFKVGEEMVSLYEIEHKILKKLNDPRVHFAINCASKSCPPLGRRIFIGEKLDLQLDEKTTQFINDENHVKFDHLNKIIYLNKIFKWYKKDFKNVKRFIIKYLKEDIDYSLIKNYKIIYLNYDWSSNNKN